MGAAADGDDDAPAILLPIARRFRFFLCDLAGHGIMQSRYQMLHGDVGIFVGESIIDLLRCDLRHGGGHSARLRLGGRPKASHPQHPRDLRRP